MMSTSFARPFLCFLILTGLLGFTACRTTGTVTTATVNWKKTHVLVYTKNGKGFVHDNIPFASAAFQKMGQEHGFTVDVSDNPAVFSDDNLKKYDALVFTSTNNEVFDTDAQKVAFMRYIQSGGGFMGVHSAIGTERKWTWFKMMLGGTFSWHAKFQPFKVVVIDPAHPSVQGVPKEWMRDDECYFSKEMYPGIKTLIAHDVSSLKIRPADSVLVKNVGSFGNNYPAVWYQHFDGGHVWYTSFGHDKKDYQDATYLQHLYQGLHWVVSQTQGRSLQRAYATTPDTPVRY